MEQGGAFFEELSAETVFNPAQGKIEIGDDELVGAALHDRDETNEAAFACDSSPLIGKLEAAAGSALFVAEL